MFKALLLSGAIYAAQIMGFELPPEEELIEMLPTVLLSESIDGVYQCGGGAVACYRSGTNQIILPLHWDAMTPMGKAILLHETVHWLQFRVRGVVLPVIRCKIEQEAYMVMDKYLAAYGLKSEHSLGRVVAENCQIGRPIGPIGR